MRNTVEVEQMRLCGWDPTSPRDVFMFALYGPRALAGYSTLIAIDYLRRVRETINYYKIMYG